MQMALQVLLLALAGVLMNCPFPICAASRYSVTLRQGSSPKGSSSSRGRSKGSKAKSGRSKRKSGIIIGPGINSGSRALIIIAIIAAVVVILIAAYWLWQRRRARKYIEETEKLAAEYRLAAGGAAGDGDGEPVLRLFSHKEMKQATDGFTSKRVLARDSSLGDVYKGVLADETQVAIKSMKTSRLKGKEEVLNEVKGLSEVNHPNVVRLVGFCVRWKRLLLVYEHAPNGSLSDQLKDGTAVLDWKARLQVALQSAEALAHLHSSDAGGPNVCHGDVKSNSILLDQAMNAKVSDYGLSRFVGKQLPASKWVPFSPKWPWLSLRARKSPHGFAQAAPMASSGYLDPEYIQNDDVYQLTDKSDVYSFGVVLLELVTSQRALDFSSGQNGDHQNLVVWVQTKKKQGKLDDVPDREVVRGASTEEITVLLQSMRAVVDLALECLNEKGVNRPLMEEVVERLRKIMSSLPAGKA